MSVVKTDPKIMEMKAYLLNEVREAFARNQGQAFDLGFKWRVLDHVEESIDLIIEEAYNQGIKNAVHELEGCK